MKKLKYIIALGLGLSVTSCTKTLDVNPQDSIDAGNALTTITGVNSLLATVYSNLRATTYYGNSYKIVPDIMADNIYPIPGLNSNRLINESVNAPRAHMANWGLYTSAINQVNLVIDAVNNVSGTAAEKSKILGQAYGLRGLFYWDMVKLYGYNPAHPVGSSNLGVPIITVPTKTLGEVTFPKRNTVEEVYAQIEKDLLAAETALDASVAAPYYMSKPAVQAILAKVYLYWGKNDKAAVYADKVIQARGNTFVAGADYAGMYYKDSNPEAVFELAMLLPQMAGINGLQSFYSQYPADYGKRQDQTAFDNNAEPKVGYGDFTPTPELLALYESGDVRRGTITTGKKSNTVVNYVRKYTPTQGNNFLQNIVIFRISEMYLIRAEGNLRAGTNTGATPQADLDKIRTRAGLTSVPVTLDAILKERRIELAFEGDRWFDLVRLGMDVPKSTALGAIAPIAYNTDYRILAPLPVAELSVNPNLVNNAGY
ncbi:RagB/SusD family nutrient uptake outer membrane protein [Pedobacter sp. UC225_65]|uniref:RagB/SusD family nutrient uptake outer membrane protein n=1 Tax=Pedobacter sp. UC225_65 TaxID=3350173 RepID=UPI00366E40F7